MGPTPHPSPPQTKVLTGPFTTTTSSWSTSGAAPLPATPPSSCLQAPVVSSVTLLLLPVQLGRGSGLEPHPYLCPFRFPLLTLSQALAGPWLLEGSGALSRLPSPCCLPWLSQEHTVQGPGQAVLQPHHSLANSCIAVSHCLTMMP
jgi:hypothetical protein